MGSKQITMRARGAFSLTPSICNVRWHFPPAVKLLELILLALVFLFDLVCFQIGWFGFWFVFKLEWTVAY